MEINPNGYFKNIDEIEESIGYRYEDRENLLLALTHSSYANERKEELLQSNERLEFLGDAILNITISEDIYLNRPELTEGEMTKLRANIVCENSLVKCANMLKVGRFLLLGKGEELTGGRSRKSILSDTFEALIGSIYLDGGLEKAKEFVLEKMKDVLKENESEVQLYDCKTKLQEVIQKSMEYKVSYRIIDEKGPDHDKLFIAQVIVKDKVMGVGKGKTKKEAEQNAAYYALKRMDNE